MNTAFKAVSRSVVVVFPLMNAKVDPVPKVASVSEKNETRQLQSPVTVSNTVDDLDEDKTDRQLDRWNEGQNNGQRN